MKRQIEFELDGHKSAIRDLNKQLVDAKQKAYFSSTLQARETIKYLALPMKEELINWLHELCKGRAVTMASPAMAPELLNLMDFTSSDVICIILLKSVLDTHGQFDNPTIARVASFIGERIEDEVRFRFYEITAPHEVVEAARRRVQQVGSTPKYRRLGTKILTENMLRDKYPDSALFTKWHDLFRIGIGLLLLEFCHHFGLIEKYTKRKGKKTTNYIRLTDTFKQMHADKFDEMTTVCYKSEALIEPPKPWKYRKGPARLNWSGGYHNDFIRKQHRLCRGYHYESEFGELSIKFLNMIGSTAWTVDHTIVKVALDLKERGISAGNFNAYERDPRLDHKMPEHLTKLDTEHPDRVSWRKNQFRLHQIHNEEWRKAVRSVKSLQAAEKFLSYPRFYLSWSNDYRGRCYPQQPWLSPQTTEFEKSLIKFADGCKLDARGKWWAAQAIGAAYLGTRLNLEERVRWTYENEELIRLVATEPLSTVNIWAAKKVKEPWQFLQLCIEWNKIVLTGKEQLWHIPVGADATASGLQLLSSMLLDPVGMKYSNVLPPTEDGAPPQDSYLEVLRVTREIAETEAPHLVEHLYERSIGKTTMQMLYGATHYTVREKVIKIFKKDLKLFPETVTWKDCDKIASMVEQASRKVFPAAYKALDWLGRLAAEAAKAEPGHFEWTTPSGDIIRLKEHNAITLDVRTSHLGKIRIPVASTEERDYKGMSSALPPSFVHSFDASLLKIAFDGWKQPLCVIHDCFKALPTDMDTALESIRKGFYAVCKGNALADLADSLNVESKTLQRLPQGDAELTKVFDSTYLFN